MDSADSQLHDTFKKAATTLTQLYKQSIVLSSQSRADGYQDCIEELQTFLDKHALANTEVGHLIQLWVANRRSKQAAGRQSSSECGDDRDKNVTATVEESSMPPTADLQPSTIDHEQPPETPTRSMSSTPGDILPSLSTIPLETTDAPSSALMCQDASSDLSITSPRLRFPLASSPAGPRAPMSNLSLREVSSLKSSLTLPSTVSQQAMPYEGLNIAQLDLSESNSKTWSLGSPRVGASSSSAFLRRIRGHHDVRSRGRTMKQLAGQKRRLDYADYFDVKDGVPSLKRGRNRDNERGFRHEPDSRE